jgi:3-methyladenine DNA glycosylase AlkD
MTSEKLFHDIVDYCKSNASEEIVKKYSRYFKAGVYDAWGLSQAQMEAKKAEIKNSGELTLDLVFDTAPLLMKSGKYEETSFALVMMELLTNEFGKADFKKLEDWFAIGINNWAHADHLGMQFLPNLMNIGVVAKEDFSGWISSPFKFQRRCVPVTYIKLLKTEKNFNVLFNQLEPLMNDPEREVHQVMGWFLREAWKIKPAETEAFLLKWKNTAPRLIFQYACEKMKPENRLQFRRDK